MNDKTKTRLRLRERYLNKTANGTEQQCCKTGRTFKREGPHYTNADMPSLVTHT